MKSSCCISLVDQPGTNHRPQASKQGNKCHHMSPQDGCTALQMVTTEASKPNCDPTWVPRAKHSWDPNTATLKPLPKLRRPPRSLHGILRNRVGFQNKTTATVEVGLVAQNYSNHAMVEGNKCQDSRHSN